MPRNSLRSPIATPVLVLALLFVLMILPAVPSHLFSLVRADASTTATFIVNSTGDGADSNLADGICNDGTGACTLRAAIQEANLATSDDTITFAASLNGSVITLNAALADINSNLSITGPGANLLTVKRSTSGGTPNFRIFRILANNTVTISGLTISNGNATGTLPAGIGGGVLNEGVLVISSCLVSQNSSSDGGGIANRATLTVNNCTIDSNTTTSAGGGISNGSGESQSGTLTINNSTISNNISQSFGGGGIANIAQATVTNSTISSNTGVNGGAINNANPMTLTNVTITGNTASNAGGGIFNPGIGIINFGNTIVAGNTSPTGPDCNGFNLNSQDYNLIGNTSDGNFTGTTTHNITNVNGLLGPLASNGGPTLTHALLAGSPAIDAGNTAVVTDQRGQPRPIDDQAVVNAAGGNASDIGAYEAHTFEVNTTSDGDDGLCRAPGTGNGCTLREAINAANAETGAELITFAPALTSGGPATITMLTVLPDIASDIIIRGAGANLLTIRRSAAPGTPNFRIFRINSGADATILGMTITNGLSEDGQGPAFIGAPGGGILNVGTLTLSNVTIRGNHTGTGLVSGGPGAGIFNDGTLTLSNSTISGNETGLGGQGGSGAGVLNVGTMTIVNTTVSGNQTSSGNTINGGFGGGIYNVNHGTLTLINATVSGNTTGNGTPAFMGGSGGGIFNDDGGTVNIKNSIVANNIVGTGGSGPDLSGTFNSQDFNLLENTTGSNFTGTTTHDITGQDPRLGSLANNGGPTETQALLAGSPALDAGDDCVFSNACSPAHGFSLTTDQRGAGFSRRLDGPDADTTETVDIGAFEAQVSIPDIADQTMNEDDSFSLSFGVGGSASITSVTVISSNTALVPNDPANISISGNGSTRMLLINPVANAFGTSTITLTVNGNNSQSMTDTFLLTVNSVNDPPSFTKGPDQTVNNDAGMQTVSNWATNMVAGPPDESGQTFSFLVVANSDPGMFSVAPTISSTGTLTYAPATNAGGTATITVVLKDSGGTANGGQDTSSPQSFHININPVAGFLKFDSAGFNTTENSGFTTITVSRVGDLSRAVTVDYATSPDMGVSCATANGIASPKCDFTSAFGTLHFAGGEAVKTFTVLINQDSYVEGAETLTLTLSNPTGGSAVGSPSTATLTIADDATEPPTNPIDTADAFVRQHYHDFLNREPDASGFAFWTNEITSCGANTQCIELKRINVSAAFFLSIEFQETGYLVYRIYKASYGDITGTPVPVRLNEFLPDTQQIGKDVIVGQPGFEQQLENNKVAFALDFVSRSRFTTAYPTTMTPAQFVDALFANAGVTPSTADRDAAINEFGGAANSADVAARARALRRVAENTTLKQQEFNRAFVLMEYFGYLRRNPNDPPEANLDFGGYNFWLAKLNQFNGNFVAAEMVKAFLVSSEYRQRFGP